MISRVLPLSAAQDHSPHVQAYGSVHVEGLFDRVYRFDRY